MSDRFHPNTDAVRAHYAVRAATYNSAHDTPYQQALMRMWRSVLSKVWGSRPCETMVDLGCGTGAATRLCSSIVKPKRIVGIDCCEEMLDVFRRDGCASTHLTLHRVDMRTLPLADCSADLVVSTRGCLIYTDVRATLIEVHRVLRPGGILIFDVNNRHSVESFIHVAVRDSLVTAIRHWRYGERCTRLSKSINMLEKHLTLNEVIRVAVSAEFICKFITSFPCLFRFLPGANTQGADRIPLGTMVEKIDRGLSYIPGVKGLGSIIICCAIRQPTADCFCPKVEHTT